MTTETDALSRLEAKLNRSPEFDTVLLGKTDLRMVLTELRALRAECAQYDRLRDAYADAVGYEWEG